jgi:hypothetical protein
MLTILIMMFTLFAQADVGNFKVALKGNQYFAVSGNLKLPLRVTTGEPTLRGLIPIPQHPDLKLLVYSEGLGGTSQLYEIERAIVLSGDSSKSFGDFPFKYLAKGGAPRATQPEWVWRDKSLSVNDEQFGFSKTVFLK